MLVFSFSHFLGARMGCTYIGICVSMSFANNEVNSKKLQYVLSDECMSGNMEGKERGRRKEEKGGKEGRLINDAVSGFHSYKMAWACGRDAVSMVKTLPFIPNSLRSVGG